MLLKPGIQEMTMREASDEVRDERPDTVSDGACTGMRVLSKLF